MTTDRPGFDSVALSPEQERALQRLAFAIETHQGRFKLLIARCNYADLVDQLLAQLQTLCAVEVRRLVLQPGDRQLFAAIERAINPNPPGALAVVGFGGLTDGDLRELFAQANRSREAFRDRFPLPLVWWLDDRSLQQLQNTASDLASWATSQTFAATPIELAEWVRSVAQQALDQLWATQPQPLPDVPIAELLNHQIAIATQDWHSTITSPLELAPDAIAETQIHLAWLAAIAQPTDPAAREQYEQAIGFWDKRRDGARSGALRILLGEWWRSRALLSRRNYEPYLAEARDQFAAAIAAFDQADRPNLSAKFINAWGNILQRLAAWDDLKPVAQRALELHDRYPNPFKRARACGFLGQLALVDQDWAGAIEWLDAALLAAEEADFHQWQLPGDAESLDWVQTTNQALYRFLRAQAKRGLGDQTGSLADLQAAIDQTQPDYEPRLYIQILVALAQAHRDRRDYRQAFQAKLLRQEIEQQFNFRAFVGAGRLQAGRLQRLGGSLGVDRAVPLEITAAGRGRDVEQIWQRLANDRGDAITVLFGFSGSGKSSLLNAGIIPLLQRRPLGQRDGLPVVIRDYTDWEQGLWAALQEALGDRGAIEPPTDGNWPGAIARELVRNAEQRNLATVLIFDQFEGFFFETGQRQGRSPLFAFLSQCLDITGLKIIFSIRREYIYHLLNRAELDQRIDGGLLSTNVLYRIGNFRLEEAKQVIRDLIDRAELDWEPELIEAIVSDLSGIYYKVRPIELQIVGAQVQAEEITTAAGYANSGGKVALVQRYLDAATGDCGPENVELATLILFLLTGDKTIRPLKTRAVLQEELASLNQGGDRALPDQDLDLVLEILVGSGLLLQNLSQAEPTYQLVHDYIAEFIREQQMPDLLAQMQAEREKRQVAERQLSEVQQEGERLTRENQKAKKRLQLSTVLASVLLLVAGGASFWTVAQIKELDEKTKQADYQLESVELQRGESQLKAAQVTFINSQKETSPSKKTEQLDSAYELLSDSNIASLESLVLSMRLALAKKQVNDQLISNPFTGSLLDILYHNRERDRFTLKAKDDRILDAKWQDQEVEVITTSRDNIITIWNLQGKKLLTLKGHQEYVSSASFSPDGQRIITTSGDKTAKVWDLQGKELLTLKGHQESVSGASFSPDGQRIITTSDDKTAKVWDLQGKELLTLKGHKDAVLSVSFSPDGQRIVTASFDGTAKVWNLQGKELLTLKGHRKGIGSASFSLNGQHIVTASWDGTAKVWDLQGKELLTLKGYQRGVRSASFSSDGQRIIATSWDGTAKVWDLQGEKLLTLKGHQKGIGSASFSPDGQRIVTASQDGTAKVWDLQGKELLTLKGHTDSVMSVGFSPDGQRIITTSADDTAKVWDLQGKELLTLKGHKDSVMNVGFSPDGQRIITTSADDTAKVWDLQGKELLTLKGHEKEISSASFSPDGQRIVTGSWDGTATVWDLQGRELLTLKGHKDSVRSASFSPDGQRIVTASDDETAKVWDLQGRELSTLKGHQSTVYSASFSPDGQRIVTGSWDSTANMWDLQGKELLTLKGHQEAVFSARFSPDGRWIVTASWDGTAKVWPVETLDGLLAKGCDWLRDYLATNRDAPADLKQFCGGLSRARTQTP